MASPPSLGFKKRWWASLIQIFLVSVVNSLLAQQVTPQVINFSGNSREGPFSVVTMSVGEVAVSTISGNDVIVTQGFLQPEVGVPCNDFQLSYYPNPVIDYLTIRDSQCNKLAKQIEVFDVQGKLVQRIVLDNREADMRDLRLGIYVVKAFSYSDDLIGTFRIAKVSRQ